jgi:hypothetical protein
MMWLADPVTKEPLPAFVAADRTIRRLGGKLEWLGAHSAYYPGWEESTVDDMGFQYIRRCRRECCAASVTDRGDYVTSLEPGGGHPFPRK